MIRFPANGQICNCMQIALFFHHGYKKSNSLDRNLFLFYSRANRQGKENLTLKSEECCSENL